MQALGVVARMAVRTNANAFRGAIRKSPVVAAVPFAIAVLAVIVGRFLYGQLVVSLSGFGDATSSMVFVQRLLGNLLLASTSAAFIYNLFLLQTVGDDDGMRDLLGVLPVSRRDVVIGLHVPYLTLVSTLNLLLAVPATLALARLLDLGAVSTVVGVLLYMTLLSIAVAASFALERFARWLARAMLGPSGAELTPVLSAALVFLMLGMTLWFVMTSSAQPGPLTHVAPHRWATRGFMALYSGNVAALIASMAALVAMLGILAIIIAVVLDLRTDGPDRGRTFRPLAHLPFPRGAGSVSLLQFKVTLREVQNLGFTCLMVAVLLGACWAAGRFEALQSLAVALGTFMVYLVAVTLSTMPLFARGESSAHVHVVRSIPVSPARYVIRSVWPHALFVVALGVVTEAIAFRLLRIEAEPLVLASQIPFLLMAAALAYFVGTVMQVRRSDAVSQLMASITFMSLLGYLGAKSLEAGERTTSALGLPGLASWHLPELSIAVVAVGAACIAEVWSRELRTV